MLSPVTILRLSAMIKRNVHPQRMKMKKEEKDEFEKMADDDDIITNFFLNLEALSLSEHVLKKSI